MARTYVNVMTAIWRKRKENDFIRLTGNAQRLYFVLISQAEITAAGSLRMMIDHWASLAADTTAEDVQSGLEELARTHFIVIDYATEEVLVRTFVRWDKGYGNSKRRPVIYDAAANIDSPLLRQALAVEFDRVGLSTDGLLEDSEDDMEAPEQPSLFPQVDSPSDSPSDAVSRSDRVVGGYVSREVPQPTNRKPKDLARRAGNATPSVNSRAQDLARAYTDLVPFSKFPAVMMIAKRALDSGYADARVRDALISLAEQGRSVTVDAMRIELERRPRINATDAAIAELLAPTGSDGATVIQLPSGRPR